MLTLGILFAVCPAYCNTYFVATDGNDLNDGNSIDHPFKTIGRGVTAAGAGDTIFLRGGQHNYSATISISKSGSSGNLITLQNYQNEMAIVDFSGLPRVNNTRGIELSGNYWHFKGFTIRRSADDGIYLTGSYNIFEQLIFYENGDSGIHFLAGDSASPAYNQVINCDFYLNYDPYAHGENADGFAVKSSSLSYSLGPGNVLRGCRAWSNSDDGYDLWWAGISVRIENCWAWRNGVDLWGEGGNFKGDGQGIKLGQGGGKHIVTNCLSCYNQHRGFDQNGNTTGADVNNCTSVSNVEKNFYFSTSSSNYVLHNNISYLGTNTIATNVVNTYNSWNTGFSVSAVDFASIDANGLDGPRGPNGELPKLKFMRLPPTAR